MSNSLTKLIVLGKPPIVIEHPKAVAIKTRYLMGEKLAELEEDYNFVARVEKQYIKVEEKK